ncbi:MULTISPECIES: hypothetical protein [Cyanophyceae]|uniref:Uncharacterized protein n=1 Tax=Nodularia spumigena CENA596 TaxID=1819295 RepID=A0A166L0J4_NODSP|nr:MULTISPECIES: hypothetical protein [Cyanophyceae]MDB9355632.1 hypothetical protein [Nodularia spumigena CS-587/03]KZL51756.1 hypothetical protein A2T98_00525 [Nodularia spumigena CENA596]MDB9306372.1 hypothetical protein [Nodularia spumigena CS-591/12]MDB9317956.1 hypothetical protein [Nodularia spumigena CS-590/01A]MDB9322834.1 hypothetical protein [Nodularia spumigena CS-591/07A]
MYQPYFSPDDLPSNKTMQLSGIWLSQLEEAAKKSFFLVCKPKVRILLSGCHWYFKVNSGILMLILVCHDIKSYQHIMTSIPYLANNLKRFSNQAKISVSSPVNEGIPWMVNINEFWTGEDSI